MSDLFPDGWDHDEFMEVDAEIDARTDGFTTSWDGDPDDETRVDLGAGMVVPLSELMEADE